MPIVNINISGKEARNYVNHFVDRYLYENYQPIKDLTDVQIASFVTNLETFLQTNIGTPNGYTIDVSLVALNSESLVDTEVITREVREIFLQINIT